jgi:thiosulfate reductase cytochrome b subunit
MSADGICSACYDFNRPTINRSGVSVYFPPKMFVHGADEWLAARGVHEACRWLCPTTVGAVATLGFTGGAR